VLEATTYIQRYMGSSDLSSICTYVFILNIHRNSFTTKKANYDNLVPRPHPLLRTKSGDPSQISWANYWNVVRTN